VHVVGGGLLDADPDDLETSFGPGRTFANKLWNAGRFILSNLEGTPRPLAGPAANVVRREELTLADRWILAASAATITSARVLVRIISSCGKRRRASE
jgi:valyl-tRNA synthetase